MSIYMPGGAHSAWCAMEDSWAESDKWQSIKNRKFSDVTKEARGVFCLHVSKFKLAQLLAQSWARDYLESDGKGEAEKIAEMLDLGWLECYAILDMYDLFFEELAVSDPDWAQDWQYGGEGYVGLD